MDDKFILVVEDNADDEALTLRSLQKCHLNAKIEVARDGADALDFVFGQGSHSSRNVNHLPQLVLLDLKLPKLDGLEVLKAIRTNEKTRHLLVVMFTSSREERDVAASYASGANSYVTKPVDFGQFSEAVRQLGSYWLKVNEKPIPAV